MAISLKIEKRYLWLLAAVIVFVTAIGYVIAWNSGNPQLMGHSYNELENVQYKITNGMTACSAANQAIKTINSTNGAVTCEADNIGFTTCTTISAVPGGATATATCSAGWTMAGGGCWCVGGSSVTLFRSEPQGNGWFCACSAIDAPTTAYARCCQ